MENNKTVEENQVKREIVSLLFSDTKKTFYGALLVAGLLLVTLGKNASPTAMASWIVLILASYTLRIVVSKQFERDVFTKDSHPIWLNRFRLTTLLCGLAWGSIGFFIFPAHNNDSLALLSLALAGVAASGMIAYTIDDISSMAFVGSISLLISPYYLMDGSPFAKHILLLIILFIGYVAIASKRLSKGLIDNITLRVKAENQKREIHDLSLRQNLHLEHTPIGVIEWDEKLNITSWNKACSNIFGYSSEEAIGKHISFLIPELINQPIEYIMHIFLQEQKNKADIKDIAHQDGKTIHCEWFNTALKNELGEIVGVASLVQDKTEFIKTQDRIHQLAYYDVLTNLPNRGLLADRLNQAIITSERSQEYAMVAFIDLDHFKAINDIKGHDAGDFLLKCISDRLQSNIRRQDTAARMGGDEFVLVFSGIGKTREEAELYSQQIIEKISHAIKVPVEYDGYQHQCSASIGICVFKNNALSADELLRRADISMYLAKKQGRNCFLFYDEALQPKYDYQMQLKHDLNHALATNQFQLYLQGQFNRDSKSIGAEVLLRWQHPEYGLVMPNDFIPLAEETGLIVPIGYWVIEQSCLLLKKWESNASTKDMSISVNVSAIQFNNPNFVSKMESIIKSTGCNAKKLCIELTESAVINSIEDLTHKMQLLRAMGISLAIDDFGIGYSSLSVLKDLPLNELKIDKSFVHDITNSGVESTIVQTILQMGKNLKLRIVAEGVETEHQMAYLRNYGCNLFQGYFFEMPCAVDIFEENLNTKAYLTVPK
jgi:diguanylate cyclase (GGDEF)-like protein/PAS domain S-box-containing protein